MGGTVSPTTFDITGTNVRTIAAHGAIAGEGEIVKKGTGTLVIGGNNNPSGRVTIDAGTLAVSRWLMAPITLNPNAALAGTGRSSRPSRRPAARSRRAASAAARLARAPACSLR